MHRTRRARRLAWPVGLCDKPDAAFDTDAEHKTYRDVRKPVSQQYNAGGDQNCPGGPYRISGFSRQQCCR